MIEQSEKTKLFIGKAIKIHGDNYNYSKVEYVKAIKQVIIICKEHGDFLQTPNAHLSGYNCYKCGLYINKTKSNLNEFIKRAKEIHGDKYDYSLV